jgi:hypothetical protein
MSETWFVYGDRDAREMLTIADACNDAIGSWLEEHEENDEERVAECGAGGPVPSQPEVVAAYRRYQLELPDGVVERLATCRTSIALDHPAALDESSLSVVILRFVLARVGPALVMFNDFPLVPSEEVLRRLELAGHAATSYE